MKKLFGQINITWPKLISAAVIAGIYTGIMALIPAARDTSFSDICSTFEWWVLFGILIIVNSKSPLDSALKCIVFFLISQPLVYLVQVPFCEDGWSIFRYYPDWFIWTLCTFPMGFVGHFMKKEKWWGLLILSPMLAFVGVHFFNFLSETLSFFPRHLLSAVFCAAAMIIYPLFVFAGKKLKIAGLVISVVLILGFGIYAFVSGGNVYNTTVLVNNGSAGVSFDSSYSVSLEDESFGKLEIVYDENIEDYMVKAEFKRTGETKLIVEAPDGEKRVFSLVIERHRYEIKEISGD